jgi:cytochrome c oxidase subunit 3
MATDHAAPAHPALLHHFDSLDQQREASLLGMWAFLATEVLFFGGLFLAYTLYRHTYPDAFRVGSAHLNVVFGCFNTAVLIGSSLTMALAVAGAQRGDRRRVAGFMLATILLGGVFLGVKAVEWTHDYEEELIPGMAFSHERWSRAGVAPGHGELFFVLYFSMTGLHAAHMIVGMGVMTCFLRPAWHGRYSRDYYTPIEGLGLYWHFVDIVWIFLFPLYYLVGTREAH